MVIKSQRQCVTNVLNEFKNLTTLKKVIIYILEKLNYYEDETQDQ